MYAIAKKLLFCLNPEVSHELSLDWLGAFDRLRLLGLITPNIPRNEVKVMGMTFSHPIGLAAGLDKNGDYIDALGKLGFSFIEIGTVTPLAQPGNPRPRLFRLVPEEAIINRMGFNNKGVDYLIQKVKHKQFKGILGINIGKNKLTPDASALADYQLCMEKVYGYADYITINISSPNTPGLRSLQFGEVLQNLLSGIKNTQTSLGNLHNKYTPVVVKIAPDLTDDEIRSIADILIQTGIDGVIATNTTTSREAIKASPYAGEAGGLSGKPVRDPSTQVIRLLAEQLEGRIPIIGVGGILSGSDAVEKIKAGASLVQLYSGLIFRGPGLLVEAADAIALAKKTNA